MRITLKNITISRKLTIGLITVLFSVSMISFFFIKETNELSQQTENIYNHPLTVRRAISDLKTNALLMRVEFRNIILHSDVEHIMDAKERYNTARETALEQFEVLFQRYLGPSVDIDLLHSSFVQWDRVQKDMLNRSLANKIDKALIEELESSYLVSSREELMNNIQRIEKFALNKADEFYNEANKLNANIKTQNIVYVSLSIVLIIIVIIILRRSINTPIKSLINTANSLKNGEMQVRSPLQSKDEFGLLATTMNDMATTIEDELKVKSKVVEISELMSESNDMQNFCVSMLQAIMNETNTQLAALYLQNEETKTYKAFCAFGINKNDCPTFTLDHPISEFEQAIKTKAISHLKSVPSNHFMAFETITGNFTPHDIITIPIYSNNKLVALISLASLYAYTPFSQRIINELYSVLSFRLNSVLLYKQVLEFNETLGDKNKALDEQGQELRQMADELVGQNTELEQQKLQLNEMNKLKSNFLSSMSHELRTPLNSVIALSGVLHRRLKETVPEEEYSYIGVIERNGKYLLSLINDILDLSRVESGKIDIEKIDFKVQDLLDEALSMVQIQLEQKGLKLNMQTPQKPLNINSDYDKCLHIIQNLLSNAVKFTDTGSITISAKEIIKDNHNYLEIKVSDTGIGINERDLPHVFDEFRQADGGSSRKYGGTGLGLSIARKYTQLLKGKITVDSIVGEGSTFSLYLPIDSVLTQNTITSVPIIEQAQVSPKATNDAPLKLLIVEDTEAIIVQMVDILEEQNYEVRVAHNGNEALEVLKNFDADGMLLDLMMPEMNGLELLKHIRAQEEYQYLPVIILTAKIISQEELQEIKHNHVYQLIQKGSVSKDQLLLSVKQMLNTKDVESEIKHHIDYPIEPIIKKGKINILTIEDNPDNTLALRALISEKCNLYEANNGLDGIKVAQQHTIDVILMDIAMPVMNGFDTFKAIRNDKNIKHIPIIVLTSSAMEGDKQRFLDFGFNAYVSKPIIPEKLFTAINTWVKTSDNYTL